MGKKRKKIGIVCCSNGMKPSYEKKLYILEETLKELGFESVFSSCIYAESVKEADGNVPYIVSAPAKKRAQALMELYMNDEITDIFDISGGDLANGILPYLDYEVIAKSSKCFWGYSDLTTVLNAIYTKTGKISGLYQVRHLISEYKEQHMKDLQNMYEESKEENSLYQFAYQFVQGQSMEGVVIGGNIRCFLKLAGTPYMPDFTGKILLLESRSGSISQMETFLSQLEQLGAFDKTAGILLGTFTQLEKEREQYFKENVFDRTYYPTMSDLLRKYVREDVPIAVTSQIGHGQDSKAVRIGAYYSLLRNGFFL